MRELAVVLGALYLRGLARPFACGRRGWPRVDHILRRSGCGLIEASSVLRAGGMETEALVLDSPGVLASAEDHYEAGAFLTAACAGYPARWLRLGVGAPPALWQVGSSLNSSAWSPSITVVGSRSLSGGEAAFAHEVGELAAASGLVLVSGAAPGADVASQRSALASDGRVVALLPCGVSAGWRGQGLASTVLSLCAPWEPFALVHAMERNALLYAASPWSAVVAVRRGEGGTWHGATSALRRRLGGLLVFAPDGVASPGGAALVALGAQSVSSASQAVGAVVATFGSFGSFGSAGSDGAGLFGLVGVG
ncbi:MAG: DNA-processing protein DprA [Fimbriimonas sp.]